MKQIGQLTLPPELRETERKVKKMEGFTLVYLTTVVVLMYLVMGNSQAMKTAWLEDILSMVPAITYLVAVRHYNRPPNQKFPYGYQRNFSIAFLAGSVALLAMGLYLFADSAVGLFKGDRPTIGTVVLFGNQVWMGWIMILVLVYSSVPAMVPGRKKLPLAKKLHNKILYTDADSQKADYMTGMGAVAGILGVGLGWWWADSVAAILISFSVIKDGYTDLRNAVSDLMDRRPEYVDGSGHDTVTEELRARLCTFPWIRDAAVRFRECGQVYIGEAYVIGKDDLIDPTDIENALAELETFDWRIRDLTIMPVKELPAELEPHKPKKHTP